MNPQTKAGQKFYVAAAAIAVVVLIVVATVAYLMGHSSGRTPDVIEGTAQVLGSNQVVMDPADGDEFPGGPGAFSIAGAWWTAAGVTHNSDTPPSCLAQPGARARVRLSALDVLPAEESDTARWVVTHVECL